MNHFCAHSEISCLLDMINDFGKKTNKYFCSWFDSRFWPGGVLTLNRFFCGLQRDAEVTGNSSFVRYCQSWGVLTLNRSFCGLQRNAEVTGNLFFVRYCQSWGVLTLNRFFCGLQRDVEVTGNFVRCLQLSKLKLGLELKQKFVAKFLFLNNSNPIHLECLITSFR